MVVGITDIELVFAVDDGVGIALQVEAGIASIDKYPAQLDQLALDGEDLVQNLGRRRIEDRVLQLIDAVVEVIDRGKVAVDDGVENQVEQTGGVLIIAIATSAFEGFGVAGQTGSTIVMRKSFPAKISMVVKVGICSVGASGSGLR